MAAALHAALLLHPSTICPHATVKKPARLNTARVCL